jgi:outer membrane protein
MKFHFQLLVTSLLLSTSFQAAAGQWQLGLATESSQIPMQQADTDKTTLPLINYIGEKFSFVAGEFTYRLSAEQQYELSLIAAPRSEGYEADDSPVLVGMEERESGFDLGIQALTQGNWGVMQLKINGDISDTHGGSEIVASYRYPRQLGRWMIEPAIGIALQSKELVRYYYGVEYSEVTPGRESYKGREALNGFAEITAGYEIQGNWLTLVGFRAEALDQAIVDSPIVEEDYISSVYAAVLYSF